MRVKLMTPVDGSAAFLEDEKGRRLTFPTPASGAQVVEGVNTEEITLATGGLTTDSVANLLPANSEILAVTARITQAITATTNWALGDGTTAARFTAANATLALGTTSVGLEHRQPAATNAAGPLGRGTH